MPQSKGMDLLSMQGMMEGSAEGNLGQHMKPHQEGTDKVCLLHLDFSLSPFMMICTTAVCSRGPRAL